MKKLVKIAFLFLALTLVAQPHKRGGKAKLVKISEAQQVTLAVKRMTLALDLSASQQKQIKPLIVGQFKDRKAQVKKIKEAKKVYKKSTADAHFEMANARLDKKIAFQNAVKKVLNKEQYASFRKMQKHRKLKNDAKKKKGLKNKKGGKKKKSKKNRKRSQRKRRR